MGFQGGKYRPVRVHFFVLQNRIFTYSHGSKFNKLFLLYLQEDMGVLRKVMIEELLNGC